MSLKDKLSRLHESRRRAEERDDERTGTYSANDAEEYRQPPDERGANETAGATDRPDAGVRIASHEYAPRYRHGDVALSSAAHLLSNAFLEKLHEDAADIDPEGIVFVDTETTGLSDDDYAFCIGLGRWRETGFVVRHVLMEGPEAEKQALEQATALLGEASVICTFNGTHFDLPLLERRAERHSVELPVGTQTEDPPHIDLLQVARSRLPELDSHRLSEVERELIGFERSSDLPGAEVPAVWSSYLEEGDDDLLEPVLRHNRLDIVSLCAALVAFAESERDAIGEGERHEHPAEGDESDESEGTDSDDRGSVAEQLARSYSLRRRSGVDGDENDDVSRETTAASAPSDDAHEPPQQRAASLRRRAEQLIAEHAWDEVRPLLLEIAAIHPRHPYALENLVELYEREGENEMAEHFRARLRDVTPY